MSGMDVFFWAIDRCLFLSFSFLSHLFFFFRGVLFSIFCVGSISALDRKIGFDDEISIDSSSVENERLFKKIKATKERITKLTKENYELRLTTGKQSAHVMENEVLCRQINELEELLSRPPEREELVHELAEVKILLAIESYDKEELNLQVMAMRKKLEEEKDLMQRIGDKLFRQASERLGIKTQQ